MTIKSAALCLSHAPFPQLASRQCQSMVDGPLADGRRSTVRLSTLVHPRVPSEPIIQNGEHGAHDFSFRWPGTASHQVWIECGASLFFPSLRPILLDGRWSDARRSTDDGRMLDARRTMVGCSTLGCSKTDGRLPCPARGQCRRPRCGARQRLLW